MVVVGLSRRRFVLVCTSLLTLSYIIDRNGVDFKERNVVSAWYLRKAWVNGRLDVGFGKSKKQREMVQGSDCCGRRVLRVCWSGPSDVISLKKKRFLLINWISIHATWIFNFGAAVHRSWNFFLCMASVVYNYNWIHAAATDKTSSLQ